MTNSKSSLTAVDLKNAGNKLCFLHRYEDALGYYDKAIAKNSQLAVLFSNRALCYLKLKQWPETIHDCRQALELDPNSIKAHFYLGQALAELDSYDDALRHLQRSNELAREQKKNFGDDIAYQIRLIKRRRWSKIENESVLLEEELKRYIVDLIKRDTETKLESHRRRHVDETNLPKGEASYHHQDDIVCLPSTSSSSNPPPPTNAASSSSSPSVDTEQAQENIRSKADTYISKIESMFESLKLQRRERDVPDYLCGKISFELMRDPVITPSGITYDRQDIEEHLKRVGHFDPITRQPLVSSQLIPNLAMKEVVDAYMHENEWANYY